MVSIHIQCRHGDSVGSFLRDNGTGLLHSPVFDSCVDLHLWMDKNGWVTDNTRPLGVKQVVSEYAENEKQRRVENFYGK